MEATSHMLLCILEMWSVQIQWILKVWYAKRKTWFAKATSHMLLCVLEMARPKYEGF